MRKSTILVFVLVFAAVVIFFAQRALLTRPSPAAPRVPAPALGASLEAPSGSAAQPDLTVVASGARTEAAPQPPVVTADATARLHKLRIHVAYASGLSEQVQNLEVGLSNLTGALYKPRRVGPNEFELVEALPGSYVVVASGLHLRTGMKRVEIASDTDASEVTVTLQPERVLRVGWRSSDGRPITKAIAQARIPADTARLEIIATRFAPTFDGPAPARCALATLFLSLGFSEDEEGRRVARDLTVVDSEMKRPDLPANTDTLGYLTIDDDGPVWVSALCNGALVSTQQTLPGDHEIVFTSTLDELATIPAEVKVRVVDAATGGPIADAKLVPTESKFISVGGTDSTGLLVEAWGWPGEIRASVRAEGFLPAFVRFRVQPGEELDLGTVRLSRSGVHAGFRVVDTVGKLIDGIAFDVVSLADYDGTSCTPVSFAITGSRRVSAAAAQAPDKADQGANLILDDVGPGRYVLRCTSIAVGCAPRIVEPYDFMDAPGRIVAELVVRPARLVSFVIDPPIARGTLVMLDAPDGLPVRELVVDEFGVATTMLPHASYSLHLAEHGRATASIRVDVDQDPFVFEIHR